MMEPNRENLSQYVKRIMKEKGLTLRDVELMSGEEITDGYVGGIISGRAKNLTVEKLKALARGLGVSEDELFSVARGLSVDGDGQREGSLPNYPMIINLLHASLKSRVLTELLQEVARLSPDSQVEAVKVLKLLNNLEDAEPLNCKIG